MINALLGKTDKESVAHEGDGSAAVTQVTQEYVSAHQGQKALSSSIAFYDDATLEKRLSGYINKIIECANLTPDDVDSEEFTDVVNHAWTVYERLSEMFSEVRWLANWDATKDHVMEMKADDVQLLVKDFMLLTKKCQAANDVDTLGGKKELFADNLAELQTKIRPFTVSGLLSWTVEIVR